MRKQVAKGKFGRVKVERDVYEALVAERARTGQPLWRVADAAIRAELAK